MSEEERDFSQEFIPVEASMLLASVADMKTEGYRLGQACATKIEDGIEVLYCFVKDNSLKSFKVKIDDRKPELHSITGVYGYAFVYENEMHDLFGIVFKNLTPDYGGHFYVISKTAPWNPNLGKENEEEGGEE
jgi:ech hydrogenase subunit D